MTLRSSLHHIVFLAVALAGCTDPAGPALPAVRITALGPNRAQPGGPDFYLTVRGEGFSDSSVVFWNGSPRYTLFNDSTSLMARINAADIASAGVYLVRVESPDGARSASAKFTVAVGAVAFAWDSVRPTCCNEAGVGDSVAVYFNEALDTTVLGDSGLRLRDSTVPVPGVAIYDAAAKALRFSTPLQALRFYSLAIGGQVRSVSGGALVQQVTFDFVTAAGKLVVIDTTGDFAALALGSDGRPKIAYRKGLSRVASCTGDCTRRSGWTTAAADGSPGGGGYTSFVTSGGTGYLAYQNGTDDAARATILSGGSAVIGGGSSGDGAYTSIGVAPSGRLHLFYYTAAAADLYHASCGSGCGTAGNWAIDLVDSAGSAGGFSATVTGADGRVHVVYLENGNGDLKYATCAGPCSAASWTRGTIDSAGFVGVGSSLLMDGTGRLHLAYYDVTNGREKYGTCDSLCDQAANWAIGSVLQVAPAGTSLGYSVGSLAIGPTGTLTFAFASPLNNDLESATCTAACTTAGSWTVSRLSYRGSSNVYQGALKVDAAGVRHLVWTDPLGWLQYMQY